MPINFEAPISAVHRLIKEIDARLAKPTRSQAAELCESLMRCFPPRDGADPRIFIAALATVFSAFPLEAGRHVVHPVTGLPAKLKWFPALSEVNEALRSYVERLNLVRHNALKFVSRSEDREHQRALRAEREKSGATDEQRKAKIDAVLAKSGFRVISSGPSFAASQAKAARMSRYVDWLGEGDAVKGWERAVELGHSEPPANWGDA
jgi:hypothetical protein